MPLGSVIIPSLGRSSVLRDCMESLWAQTNQDFEIVTITEEGPLAALRNEGAKRARGKYYLFIDDDVVCEKQWFEAVMEGFSKGYAGISGPSYTTKEYQRNRDCFKFGGIPGLLSSRHPGTLSPWGQWSLAATKEDCFYNGEVDYLEACNMAFKASAFNQVGGFDESYKGVGDWSEPDLCFRLRRYGHKLFFSRNARVEHRPSQSGAYKKRLVKCSRMENYELFSQKFIKPTLRHKCYKQALKTYFWLKERKYV